MDQDIEKIGVILLGPSDAKSMHLSAGPGLLSLLKKLQSIFHATFDIPREIGVPTKMLNIEEKKNPQEITTV
jgi:hypothetical protein